MSEREEKKMPDEITVTRLATLYKMFGDETRIRILFLLYRSEMCVGDLALGTGLGISAVSHQLSILKQAELVRSRRMGKSVIYSLADDHVSTILGNGLEHVNEDK